MIQYDHGPLQVTINANVISYAIKLLLE